MTTRPSDPIEGDQGGLFDEPDPPAQEEEPKERLEEDFDDDIPF